MQYFILLKMKLQLLSPTLLKAFFSLFHHVSKENISKEKSKSPPISDVFFPPSNEMESVGSFSCSPSELLGN